MRTSLSIENDAHSSPRIDTSPGAGYNLPNISLVEQVTRSAPHVLIIGGGFAGVNAAIALEGSLPRQFPLRITLVSKENFFL